MLCIFDGCETWTRQPQRSKSWGSGRGGCVRETACGFERRKRRRWTPIVSLGETTPVSKRRGKKGGALPDHRRISCCMNARRCRRWIRISLFFLIRILFEDLHTQRLVTELHTYQHETLLIYFEDLLSLFLSACQSVNQSIGPLQLIPQ